MEQFIKDKKKIGIYALVIIAVIFCGIKYITSGEKELKKNNTESIFVDENNIESEEIENEGGGKSESASSSSKSYENNKNEEVFTPNNKNKLITVEIKGEVNKPDVYTLAENSIIKDLIEKAGGLTESADLSNINRAKKLQDHELIYISNKNEAAVNNIGGSQASVANKINTEGSTNASSNGKININTANTDELKKINGIGDSKAKSIINYREQNGGFSSIEDLKNVDGIGDKMFEKIKDSVEC